MTSLTSSSAASRRTSAYETGAMLQEPRSVTVASSRECTAAGRQMRSGRRGQDAAGGGASAAVAASGAAVVTAVSASGAAVVTAVSASGAAVITADETRIAVKAAPE